MGLLDSLEFGYTGPNQPNQPNQPIPPGGLRQPGPGGNVGPGSNGVGTVGQMPPPASTSGLGAAGMSDPTASGVMGALASPPLSNAVGSGTATQNLAQVPVSLDRANAGSVSDNVTTVQPLTAAQRPYAGDMGARDPLLVRPSVSFNAVLLGAVMA